MTRRILRITSIVLFAITIYLIYAAMTVRGSSFIDLSPLARQIFGVLALITVTAAALMWRDERKAVRIARLAVWDVTVAAIAFAVFGEQFYRRPSQELPPSASADVFPETVE